MPIKLSFEALEVLDVIDRTGTFAEAAELLHRVPSALTYLVQKIESDLGVELFDRSGRRARLTQAGRVLVEEGRQLLKAARQLEMKAQGIQRGWESELSICLDEILPFGSLWPYVRSFYEMETITRLRLSTEVLGGVWDALITGRADLAVGAVGEPPHAANIAARPIGALRHLFVVAPGHPLAAIPEPLDRGTIAGFRGAVISDTSRELQPQSVATYDGQPVVVVPTLAAKVGALCEGIAVGMLPERVAEGLIREGKLVARRIAGVREHTRCYLAWREDKGGHALDWWVGQLDKGDLVDRLFNARM
ncbi:LysR substrate-binding domain-containing protein [Paraburkholderia kirstenboschensis]|uniref:LysR substrate-binding domain-containing protein n=1 Tax=Paraburkholderia kirstenboschensis TaxID=1245436 RepID=A0ABZ0EFH1_9BURK|nr:LysR substrate-binding domain-containing protein [Paraburkholderia kirstenboschensis]WOD15942.1 LysR substrate-binding domain-containing protein [Paraburkholderia kirstenboschensis]